MNKIIEQMATVRRAIERTHEPGCDYGAVSSDAINETKKLLDLLEVTQAPPAAEVPQSPSYGALLIIAQSVQGALLRAGVEECDDPGEAIDVMRERYERRIAELKAPPAAAAPDGVVERLALPEGPRGYWWKMEGGSVEFTEEPYPPSLEWSFGAALYDADQLRDFGRRMLAAAPGVKP